MDDPAHPPFAASTGVACERLNEDQVSSLEAEERRCFLACQSHAMPLWYRCTGSSKGGVACQG
ncbi:hypothetical protein SynA1528_01499 [Synechococcus sp. A15-28]|nr:hypothetical protein SynA1528_01499 [Synechococcus sp. A15-28]